jgi:hypothetical protein
MVRRRPPGVCQRLKHPALECTSGNERRRRRCCEAAAPASQARAAPRCGSRACVRMMQPWSAGFAGARAALRPTLCRDYPSCFSAADRGRPQRSQALPFRRYAALIATINHLGTAPVKGSHRPAPRVARLLRDAINMFDDLTFHNVTKDVGGWRGT